MFARRLYKLVRRSAQPPVQPEKPEPLDEPLREEDEERLTQRLYELDRSSAQFPERLDELLRDEGWMKDLQRLSQHKLVELIDYLDNVRFISMPTESCSSSLQILDDLDHTGSQFKEGLHALRKLCGLREILPATYLVSGKLSISTAVIVKPGKYSEIRKGSLGGADVCIKVPWMLTGNQLKDFERVSHPHTLWLDRHVLTSFEGTTQGGRDMEVPQSPKYCALQGRHPQPPSTHVGMDALQKFDGICQGKSVCKLNRPREFIPSRLQASPHPILSCLALPKGLVIFTRVTLSRETLKGYMKLFTLAHPWLMKITQLFILVDTSGNARIADFGCARIARNKNADGLWIRASAWAAPEIRLGDFQVTKESDIFSFGMVIIEVGGDRTIMQTN